MTTDKDLRFLSSCENEDLRVLCDILTHDRLGNIRVTEQLTATDEYNRNYPEDMLFLVPQISNELLKYGSKFVPNRASPCLQADGCKNHGTR